MSLDKNLSKEFERRAAKIDQLNDFVELYCKKEKMIHDLEKLRDETINVNNLAVQCREFIDRFQNINKERYRQLILRGQKLQTVMLNVMEEVDKMEENQKQKLDKENVQPSNVFNNRKLNSIKEPTTPMRNFSVRVIAIYL